jgi:hypothetical protein
MQRTIHLALTLAIVASCAPKPSVDANAVVTRFYQTLDRLDVSGAPTPEVLDSLAPMLSTTLRDLLRDARALHDADVKRAPDEKPAFADGDLFTSLFEGFSKFEILGDSVQADGTRRVAIRFTYDPSPPPVTWTDHVVLTTEGRRLVVGDVVYGGDWPFANRGTLVASLRSALRPDSAPGVSIELKNGTRVRLADDTVQGDGYVVHRLEKHADRIPFHVVHASHIEGQSYKLVHDSTGHQLRIDAPPIVSPNARRFVTASIDLVAAYDPTRLMVWRVAADSAIAEWSIEPTTWGPSDARWRDDDTVDFVANFTTSNPDSVRKSPASLVFDGSRWTLRLP